MKRIIFAPETTNFFKELREEVDLYFKTTNQTKIGGRRMLVKIVVLLIIYFAVYSSIFYFKTTTSIFLAYVFLGGWSIVLGLNIGHDAAHNTVFKKKKKNTYLLLVFELLGTSSYNWVNRHLGAHHLFPNIINYDSDIQQTDIVKIFPEDKHKKMHAYQHFYMPLVYLFYILRWIVYRDFKDYHQTSIGAFDNSKFPRKELFKIVFSKLFYLGYVILLPSLVLGISIWSMVLAFFVLTLSGSFVITMVLLSTHVGENTNFPSPNEDGVMPHSWSYHQLLTTSDFSTDNPIINFLFGGFNHHVIHHLFPNICHIHYPELTKILSRTAKKYGAPYKQNKYLYAAMFSHFKLLKENSKDRNNSYA